jgi:cellulose synthase/poly-beta-1,6-N-acetylglucosamine synthase-like glycosyltransferase
MNSESLNPRVRHLPLVSVIMPCYKVGEFIGEALESDGSQTYSSWEVIAVDDCGPEDGTRSSGGIVSRFKATNRVKYIRLPESCAGSAAQCRKGCINLQTASIFLSRRHLDA